MAAPTNGVEAANQHKLQHCLPDGDHPDWSPNEPQNLVNPHQVRVGVGRSLLRKSQPSNPKDQKWL